MNVAIEKSAKTVEEAINRALEELNATIDEVEVTIIESGSKGILGIGSKPAKVLVKKNYDPADAAKAFLLDFFSAMKMAVDIETLSVNEKQLAINLKGENMGILIGKHGQTLDALQYLVNIAANKGEAPYVSITLDTEDYRKKRRETLENLAVNLAKKAKYTKRNVILEPMTSYERRIIHSALQGDKYVKTFSEGKEPNRYIVITSK